MQKEAWSFVSKRLAAHTIILLFEIMVDLGYFNSLHITETKEY